MIDDEATSIYNLNFELGRIRVRPLSRSPSGNRHWHMQAELVARLRRRPRSSSGLRLQLGLRKAPGTRPGRAAWPPRAKTRTLSRPGVHLKLPAAWRPGRARGRALSLPRWHLPSRTIIGRPRSKHHSVPRRPGS